MSPSQPARLFSHPWRIFCALALCLNSAGALAAQRSGASPDGAAELLPQLYARYLSEGRSEVEIHLSAAGATASARVAPLADGSFSCRVAGLRAPLAGTELASTQLQLAAVLVHEVTHCLVSPYTAHLLSDGNNAAARAADRLLLLSAESISDARAVIEVFRQDGAEAAQALVKHLLPRRLNASSSHHTTALALQQALAQAQRWPESIQSATQAFATALNVGRDSALQTLTEQLTASSAQDALLGAEFKLRSRALDSGLVQAQQAFSRGRFANNALTLHMGPEWASGADWHYFIGEDGALSQAATLGAEGAHRLSALAGMLADMSVAGTTPEHRLAVQWLQQEGRLDTHSLVRTRLIIARFLGGFGSPGAAQLEQAAQTLEQAIADEVTQGRRGEGLAALLDSAAEKIKLARGP